MYYFCRFIYERLFLLFQFRTAPFKKKKTREIEYYNYGLRCGPMVLVCTSLELDHGASLPVLARSSPLNNKTDRPVRLDVLVMMYRASTRPHPSIGTTDHGPFDRASTSHLQIPVLVAAVQSSVKLTPVAIASRPSVHRWPFSLDPLILLHKLTGERFEGKLEPRGASCWQQLWD